MYPGRTLGRTTVATDGTDETDARVVERRAIEAVLAGERAAFRVLVERHHRGVQAMMLRFVHNGADAEDLAQSAFIAAFDALGNFDVEQRFSTWIYRIAINLAKDHLKSKKRTETALPGDDVRDAAFAGHIAGTDEATHARQRQALLERALATLSVEDREILVLKDLEELPFEEIKALTGRPVTALKIRAVRARARLRQALERLAPREAL
ncbi:MAG TPA: sigma-70 family RNA polymerase sigma factor [Polyangia bacterium]